MKHSTSPHRFLDQLLDAELEYREERRIRTALRLSGLPTGQTIENFDFSFQPSVERSKIETLGTCAWIREHYTHLLHHEDKNSLPKGVYERTGSPWHQSGS